MDECYVVEVSDNYANSDNMNIVHVYSTGLFSQNTQVIAVASPTTQTNEQSKIHPLDVEVQRSNDIRRQNELARLNNNSVIQTLGQPSLPAQPLAVVDRPTISRDDPKDQNRVLWLPESSRTISYSEPSDPTKDDFMDTDNVQIPLTIQNCCETADSRDCNKQNAVESDDESARIEPVGDYDPDPESPNNNPVDDLSDMSNKCYMCFKKFKQRKNMYAHIRKIHSSQPLIKGGIVCPLCKMHALRQQHLRMHLEKLHEMKIKKEERQFNSMAEFLNWKSYTEKETLSMFISKSSSKLLSFNQTKTYYKCHRSGFIPTKFDKKKKTKPQASSKIGATCPAAMEVIENLHGVTVTFWSTHVGHTNDVKHLQLNKEEKAMMGDLMTPGLSDGEVLQSLHSNGSASTKPELSKQDLQSIKYQLYRNLTSYRPCKVNMGRKPKKERPLRSASQTMVLDKAESLISLLEKTEIIPEYRPQICLMIDNLISTIKRRAVEVKAKRKISNKRVGLNTEYESAGGKTSFS